MDLATMLETIGCLPSSAVETTWEMYMFWKHIRPENSAIEYVPLVMVQDLPLVYALTRHQADGTLAIVVIDPHGPGNDSVPNWIAVRQTMTIEDVADIAQQLHLTPVAMREYLTDALTRAVNEGLADMLDEYTEAMFEALFYGGSAQRVEDMEARFAGDEIDEVQDAQPAKPIVGILNEAESEWASSEAETIPDDLSENPFVQEQEEDEIGFVQEEDEEEEEEESWDEPARFLDMFGDNDDVLSVSSAGSGEARLRQIPDQCVDRQHTCFVPVSDDDSEDSDVPDPPEYLSRVEAHEMVLQLLRDFYGGEI